MHLSRTQTDRKEIPPPSKATEKQAKHDHGDHPRIKAAKAFGTANGAISILLASRNTHHNINRPPARF